MSLSHPAPRRERRIPVRTIGAVSASVLAFPLATAPADGAVFPTPKPTKALPAALDVAAPYQKGTQCLTENQPGAVAFAKLLNATYGTRTYGILRQCAAEHGEGRALDWMISANNKDQLALANSLTRWLAAPDSQGRAGAMARRFGINYIIFNRQQWRAYAPERGWTPYYGVSPHTDHIHFSFNWDGAYKRSSWWSGVAVTRPSPGPAAPVTPPPAMSSTGYPILSQGASGPEVALAQKAIGAEPDGKFGALTAAALGTWQSKNKIPATKKLDEATWGKLVALGLVPNRAPLERYVNVVLKRGSSGSAVKALQTAIGKLSVDGSFGPATETRVKAYQKTKKLSSTGVVDSKVWRALMGLPSTATPTPTPAPKPPAPPGSSGSTSTHPLAKYSKLTLKLWSRGDAVKAMQKAIGKLSVDGSFGRKTEARVKEYQKAKGLAATGVVDAKVWKALMAPAKPAPTPPSSGTTSSALKTEFTSYKATTLKSGSTGAAVRVLQQGLGGLVVDGRMSSKTVTAVKALQTSAKLKVTGVVDRATWDALERRVHPLLTHWGTVLRKGSKGTAVVALQKALRITADGSFGPKTEAAVKALQKSAKLTQTGLVGTVTWKAVEARMPR